MCYRAIGLVLVLVGCAGVAGAISAPLTDPSYIPHDDFVSWNWRDLAQNPGIPLLATPSGQTNLIRMYANYANTNPKSSTLDFPVVPRPGGDLTGSAAHWYGLGFNNQNKVDSVLTGGDVLTAIRTLTGDPTANSPLFGFDQSQNGTTGPTDTGNWRNVFGQTVTGRDIWLRGRLILVGQGLSSQLVGKTAAEVDTLLAPKLAAITPGAGFAPGVDTANGITVFYFRETMFNDFTNPSLPANSFNWSRLPDVYDPNLFLPGLPFDYAPVNNNTGGAYLDWGGYLPGLDLTKYQNYSFLLSLESFNNNGGGEEAYIVGANSLAAAPPGPEPLTIAGVFFAVGGLARYASRRGRSRSTVQTV